MAGVLQSTVRAGPLVDLQRVETLVEGLDHPEGVAYGPDGYLYAGGEAGQVYRISPAGEAQQIACTGGFILGLALDAQANVYACDSGRKQVVQISPAGVVRALSSGAPEAPFRNPNFPVFDRRGRLYVSDSGEWQRNNGIILRIDPNGATTVAGRAAHRFPNGMALSAGDRWLYVVESTWPGVSRLAIDDDGSLGVREEVVFLPGTVPDGVAFDHTGNLYISCYRPDRIYRLSSGGLLEVWAEDPAGTVLAAPTNLTFAGPALDRLVVANLGRWHLATIAVDVPGRPVHYPLLQSA